MNSTLPPLLSSAAPLVWVVTEGMVGTENQCLGITDAMGVSPIIKRVGLRPPWRWLSPYIGFECAATFTEPLSPPYPDILIASGRKSIAVSRYIKRKSRGKTMTVQVQDPRINPRHFDRVIVPRHDPTRGDNVTVTIATPNRITQDKLATARDEWAEVFSVIPSPRIAVLIGGSTKRHTMTADDTRALMDRLRPLQHLMVTPSRRTGDKNIMVLREGLSPDYFYDGQSANPYHGLLAWADTIMVTADSTSMISDAATTGKPVYILPMAGLTTRQQNLIDNLKTYGAVRDYHGGSLENWTYPPLSDATDAAEIIMNDWARWSLGK